MTRFIEDCVQFWAAISNTEPWTDWIVLEMKSWWARKKRGEGWKKGERRTNGRKIKKKMFLSGILRGLSKKIQWNDWVSRWRGSFDFLVDPCSLIVLFDLKESTLHLRQTILFPCFDEFNRSACVCNTIAKKSIRVLEEARDRHVTRQ